MELQAYDGITRPHGIPDRRQEGNRGGARIFSPASAAISVTIDTIAGNNDNPAPAKGKGRPVARLPSRERH